MLDIDGLMTGLAGTRKVFHSEADFQHALAWQIHEAMPESRIRLEVDAFPAQDRRRFPGHLDASRGDCHRAEVRYP